MSDKSRHNSRIQTFQAKKTASPLASAPLTYVVSRFLFLICISGGCTQEDGQIRGRKSDQLLPYQPSTTHKNRKPFIRELSYVVMCGGLNKQINREQGSGWRLGGCQHRLRAPSCRREGPDPGGPLLKQAHSVGETHNVFTAAEESPGSFQP